MRDRIGEFEDDVAVVVVTFTKPEHLDGYDTRLGLGFPLVSDRSRLLYAMFGFGRAPAWRVWGPQGMKAWIEALRAGRGWQSPFRSGEDTLQLGGDVVLDRSGRIHTIHRPTGSHDRPSVDRLIADVAEAADRS